MKQGKLIIFSAPSGSGKTTIVRHLLSVIPQAAFSVSACTREKRAHEVEGRDYYFLTESAFQEAVKKGEFVEWEEVYPGAYYGTLAKEVERLRNAGKHVFFDIDVEGGLNLKKMFGKDALAVFVRPVSLEILKERLTVRSTESESQINMRIGKAEKEMGYASHFDRVLVNDDLDMAFKDAEQLVLTFLNSNE